MCPGNHNCLGSLADCQMRVTLMLKPPSSITPLREGVKGTLSLTLRSPTPSPQFFTNHFHGTPHSLTCSWESGLESEFLGFFSSGMEPEVEQSRRENREGKRKRGVWSGRKGSGQEERRGGIRKKAGEGSGRKEGSGQEERRGGTRKKGGVWPGVSSPESCSRGCR